MDTWATYPASSAPPLREANLKNIWRYARFGSQTLNGGIAQALSHVHPVGVLEGDLDISARI